MKIGVIEEPGVLKVDEREKPTAQGDEVVIKVKRVGICGSDIHILHGQNPFATYPRVFGHEFVGEVVEAGPDVKNLKLGDRVVAEPIQYCGECYACRKGRGNICVNLRVIGVHKDGGCQEYVCLPEKNFHKLPADADWDKAVLIEPFTIGAQTSLRGDVQPGDVVFVMGAGAIGLTAVQMAKLNGATVIVTDLVDEKLEYAKTMGADYTINAKTEDVSERLSELTEGFGPNVTIDAVCTPQSFEQAVDVTSAAGRVVELGLGGGVDSEIQAMLVTKKELDIRGSRLQTNRFPVVIDYFNQGKLKLDGFVTKVVPFSQLQQAFSYIEENPDKVRKIVIDMEN